MDKRSGTALHFDTSSNFHPFECDGPGKCIHHDRRHVGEHDPATCALCDPEYDYAPNAAWDERLELERRETRNG